MDDQNVPQGQRERSNTQRGNQSNQESSAFEVRNQNMNQSPESYINTGQYGNNKSNLGSFPGLPGVITQGLQMKLQGGSLNKQNMPNLGNNMIGVNQAFAGMKGVNSMPTIGQSQVSNGTINASVAPTGVPAMQNLTDKRANQQRFAEEDGEDGASKNNKRGGQSNEDQYFKKQMEFKGGKRHQLITDQFYNSNKIYANRYQGILGVWYFIIDCVYHFENFLAIVLFLLILSSEQHTQIKYTFPVVTLSVNITLMAIRNLTFELRQRKITNKINNKMLEYLMITVKFKRFMPITWADIKPGYIIKVRSGQEFPADSLILDIQGANGSTAQKCYVTSGPFDDATGIIQKRSYVGTSNKTGSKQNATHFAEMISGLLKFEYNYFGYIMGSFKLNENPASIEFDHENVVQRGALLTHSPEVICLVLNVGDQCMGSVYKDPKNSLDSQTNQKLKSFVKTQRSFDKAYKQSIRLILIGLSIVFMSITALGVYLSSNPNFFNVSKFEELIVDGYVGDGAEAGTTVYLLKGAGFYSILLSSIPLSFSNIIDLLVLMSTNFAEWDVNVAPAKINFIYPHATLAFGKVAHMFFSRVAVQRDDKQCVKIFHIGGHFFKNQVSNLQYDQLLVEKASGSYGDNDDSNQSKNDSNIEDLSLDYLPNELIYTNKFYNDEAELILNGENNMNKKMLVEFFRGITLCHQANVTKDKMNTSSHQQYKYIGVLNDEIATLEFCQQLNFKLIQRKRKMMTIILQGNQERYDELGVVTTKALLGHFMTICAVRVQGQEAGVLYMKGSIATLKQYFVDKEADFQYLNLFESKFIQSGVQSIVYAKRQLSIEETNRLIITINEGVQSTNGNNKLDNLLYDLSSVQLEILGILGLQKAVHLRNRITVDEMVLNGVKPWIISKEDEQSHLTALNSLRIFQGCAPPLVINASSERVVMEQIQNALKTVTERMEQKSQKEGESQEQEEIIPAREDEQMEYDKESDPDTTAGALRRDKKSQRKKKYLLQEKLEKNEQEKQVKDQLQNSRNIVVFTGRALQEIMRDQTMIKSFVTLAYISNIMVGSEITPLQKQHLLKMVRQFIGEGEYAAAIVTTPEDQFMINEADLSVNLKSKGKSADFEAVVDVTLKDFSAISYLLFKHGNHIQMRLSKAAQAFFYRSLISFLILTSYMIRSGFSGAIPYTEVYYFAFMIFLAPAEILVYAIFYKDYGYDQFYRIYGHYKYNFSFTLVELDYVLVDYVSAFFDWLIVYFPFESEEAERMVSIRDGKNISKEAYNCYQVILMQVIFFQYLRNTNIHIMYSQTLLFFLTMVGIAMIFDDDGLVGTIQLFTCPKLLLTLLFQTLMLELRNQVATLLSKLVIRRYADLVDWYTDIEERLAYEEYEDINQTFSIHQFKPLYQKINSSNIQRTLTLINTNMMKIPKTDGLEQILENINTELDNDRRGQVASGTINKWNLQLNDLNKETEYQDNKNQREIIYVRRQLIVFIATTLIFSLFGLTLFLGIGFTNVGIFYYLGLSAFSFVMYQLLPRLYLYLSKTLLCYTVIVIFCYTIYTSGSESLQPAGLIFVLALVAGLNHSYIFPTITMIMGSVAMFNFFSFLAEDDGIVNSGLIQFNRTFVWFFTGIVWSAYVYMQELEKKTQFINGHRRVRNFAKLKKILDILVPSLVRDKMRQGTKNFAEIESEITVVVFDIHAFDEIVKSYTTKDLLTLLDQVYNVFDQLCDQYGLQKIETVGKTYMACGGLKSAERKIDTRLLNRHHSVRVTDFAIECSNYVKTIFLKNAKSAHSLELASTHLQIKIAIHTGPVISGVVGETKPQFSLIGETCQTTSRICQAAEPLKVTVSKETLRYLELYTNNLQFKRIQESGDDFSKDPLYEVSVFRGRFRKTEFQKGGMASTGADDQKEQNQQEIQMAYLRTAGTKNVPDIGLHGYEDENELHAEQASFKSERSGYESGQEEVKNHRQYIDEREYNDIENESNKSGLIDDGTMNLFGFNDDLNLDDKVIVQNATENNIYQVVERPKYLLQFEQKDLEQDFLFQISKQEANRTTMYLVLLIVLNKIIILGDQLLDGEFSYTPQFILMFPVFLLELTLCYKLLNPVAEYIFLWTGILHLYGVIVLGILLSLQVKYLGKWTQAGFNELQIQLTITLLFFMRNVLFRHFIVTYSIYMLSWIFTVTVLSTGFSYQIIQFIIGQIMYAILLGVGIHHREMIQRKSMNYERILNVEINKTNDLISKLVPFHMLSVIKSEKRQVDEFDGNLTLLFADMVGFQQLTKSFKDARDSVILLSKIFSRFDQLCDENRVYKVYTYGSKYVVMGYTGRREKSKRAKAVILEEANGVIQTGLEMIDTIQEFKEQMQNELGQYLDIKVGIHTGHVVAGIIGSKVVRYDIFGQGVVIGNKINAVSPAGNVTVSEETRQLVMSQPEGARDYNFEPFGKVDLKMVNRSIMTYLVKKNEEASNKELEDSHNSYGDDLLDDQSQSSDRSNKSLDNAGSIASKSKSSVHTESVENVGLLKKSRGGGFSVDKSNHDSD